MKNFKLLITCLFLALMIILVNCGDAGVQVKAGSDYQTVINVTPQSFGFNQEPPFDNPELNFSESQTTAINSDFKDYGDRIEAVEVKSLSVTFDEFRDDQPDVINGEITVTINNNIIFTTGLVPFINGQTIELLPENSSTLRSLESVLEGSDVRVELDAVTDAPLVDWEYDVSVGILAFATVKAD